MSGEVNTNVKKYKSIYLSDITIGAKFGDVTILDVDVVNYTVLCQCKCGNKFTTSIYYLKHKLNCGCNKLRGKSYERLYGIRYKMIDRCTNPNNINYERYGGRGIQVCSEWLDKVDGYKVFKSWAEITGYSDNLELDRIDNNGNYTPDNCHWVSHKENMNNRNAWGKKYIYLGELLPVCDIARKTGITYSTIYNRINKQQIVSESDITPICRQILEDIQNRTQLSIAPK